TAIHGFLAQDGSGVDGGAAGGFDPFQVGRAAVLAEHTRIEDMASAVLALRDDEAALDQGVLVHLYRPRTTEIRKGMSHWRYSCSCWGKAGGVICRKWAARESKSAAHLTQSQALRHARALF